MATAADGASISSASMPYPSPQPPPPPPLPAQTASSQSPVVPVPSPVSSLRPRMLSSAPARARVRRAEADSDGEGEGDGDGDVGGAGGLVGEDSVVFRLADQRLASWAYFSGILSLVLYGLSVIWIDPSIGVGTRFLDVIAAVYDSPESISVVFLQSISTYSLEWNSSS